MQGRTLVLNALIASLYFVVTAVVAPFGFMNLQFRLSELFNHLIVFHRRYFYGIILGVVLANLVFSPTKADLFFGVLHTALSLGMTMLVGHWVKNKLSLMAINTVIFSFNMYIIAYMLKVFVGLTDGFMFLWVTLGLSELFTMGIAIILVYALHRRLNFTRLMDA